MLWKTIVVRIMRTIQKKTCPDFINRFTAILLPPEPPKKESKNEKEEDDDEQ